MQQGVEREVLVEEAESHVILRLVEEAESHLVILLLGLFLLLLLLGLGGRSSAAAGSSGRGRSGATAGWDGRQLLGASGDQLLNALALELVDDLVELLVFGVDTDGGDDGLNVSSRGAGVAAEDSQKVSSHVTHG